MLGRTIAHYVIIDRLGGGGMGEIYRAKDTRLNRTVAIKVLPNESSGDPQRRQRFIQEAQAASGLNHPNIITVHDILSDGGADLLVMELVSGKTLSELLTPGGMPVREILNIGLQMASALAVAHSAGIVHRDIKPGNIMVTSAGLVKVLDFGLAKSTMTGAPDESGETRSIASPLTVQGTVLGTVKYMSPEQAEGKRVDGRSDVFSLGIVLYEMATGRAPFDADSMIATMSAILRDEPRPVRELAPDTPQPLIEIIERCLRKDPAERWPAMDDLRNALQALKLQFDTGSVPSIPATVAVAAAARGKKSKIPLVVGASALCLALAGAGGWWLVRQRAAQPQPAPPPQAEAQPQPVPQVPSVPAPAPDAVLTNDSVIELVKNAVPPPVILDHIRSSKTKFDLSTPEVIRLSKAGVPANLIQAMRDPSKIPAQPKPVAPAAAAKNVPTAKPGPAPQQPQARETVSVPAVPVPAPVAPAPPVPAPPPPAQAATTTVNVQDGLPFAIELTQDVPNDAAAGTPIAFRVSKDVVADGSVIIPKGAAVSGQVVDESRKRALVVNVKMTYQLLKADASGGQKLNVRTTPSRGQAARPLDTGVKKKPKDMAAAAGTPYIAYIDGAQTVVLRK